jgi:hypothetical protein
VSAPDTSDAAMLAAFGAWARCEFLVPWPSNKVPRPPLGFPEGCMTHSEVRYYHLVVGDLSKPLDVDAWLAGPSYYRAEPCARGPS